MTHDDIIDGMLAKRREGHRAVHLIVSSDLESKAKSLFKDSVGLITVDMRLPQNTWQLVTEPLSDKDRI